MNQTAADIQRLYGSNYYAASLLFPKHLRDRVVLFYAFVRLADETVDNPREDATAEIQAFRRAWQQAVETGTCANEIITSFRSLCTKCAVPLEYVEAFLEAMQSDLTIARYETYQDLQNYMYGSASVIGLILLHLFDCTDPQAEAPAQALGEAMQLTNFLRDVHEDYTLRDRIYIPQADLATYRVREAELVSLPSSPAVQQLIKFECERAHDLYRIAESGITLLPPAVRPAVRAAFALYREILHEIERNQFQVQDTKIRFSRLRKLKIALLYGYVKK